MVVIRFETALFNALSDDDKVSVKGVLYSPAEERTYADENDLEGTPTGWSVMAHPDMDELDDLMVKIKKIRYADHIRGE